MRVQFIGAICAILLTVAVQAAPTNETAELVDVFEADEDLRFAADQFCHQFALENPRGKIVLPYKPNCHFWWQCTAYELKKHECQGMAYNIKLHYDLYLDRCEMPAEAKCRYRFDEEEIIMEEIQNYYKKQTPKP